MDMSNDFEDETLNPLISVRKKFQITASDLAKAAAVTRQNIYRLEKGIYVEPNKIILKTLSKASGIRTETLRSAYFNWQSWKRHETVKNLNPVPLEALNPARPFYANFKNWRQRYWTSVEAFSKALCVNPSLVAPYEAGKLRKMPVQLKKALKEVDLIDSEFRTDAR